MCLVQMKVNTNDVNGLIFKDEVYDIKKQAAKHSYQGIEAILVGT